MNILEFMKEFDFISNKWILIIPGVFMLLDFVTGFFNAWAKREIKSSKMRIGLAKKFSEVAIIVCVEFMVHGMNVPKTALTTTSGYVILMEFVSIIENAKLIGFNFPFKKDDTK